MIAEKYRILAIDISTNPGFAVLEFRKLKRGYRLELLRISSIKTDASNSDAERYAYIEANTISIVHECGPFDVVVREHFTSGRNKRSTQMVFGAWGAVDSALARYGYRIDPRDEITPSAVKKAATGKGTADKKEVEMGVRARLGLSDDFSFKSDDESDAVAIALAYLIREKIIK